MKLKRDRLFYREDDFTRYQPAGHTGTVNRRIVGPEQGSKHFEVELGIIKPRQSVSCHFLPRIDEFCDMLHDTSNVIIGGETCEVGPDEGCFFVVDTPHDFTATRTESVCVLDVYGPPYHEGVRVEVESV